MTHFIRPGTALDDEAVNRGTTVYLTDKVIATLKSYIQYSCTLFFNRVSYVLRIFVVQRIDMVPGLLSSDLCSLRSNVDR